MNLDQILQNLKEKQDIETIEKQKGSKDMKREKDGAYGWVVSFSYFMQYFVNAGLQSCAGIIHLELLRTTGAELSQIVWIGSVSVGFCTLFAPVTAVLTKRVPCRVLILSGNILASLGFFIGYFTTSIPVLILCLGVLPGLGFGLVIIPCNLVLNTHFQKRLSLAYGLSSSGVGVGYVAFPPFLVFLVETFGLQGSFLITSGILLNCTIFALLSKPSQTTSEMTKDESKKNGSAHDLFDFSLFKSYKFLLFVFVNIFTNGGNAMPFTFLPLKGDSSGFSQEMSALLISLLGCGSAFARLAFGYLFVKIPHFRQHIYLGVVLLAAASGLTTGFVESYVIIAVCSIVFGACTGVVHTEIPALLTSLFGVDRLVCSLGISNLTQGIGALVGVPIAEFICNALHDNNAAFVVISVSFTMGFIVLSIVFCCPEKRNVVKEPDDSTLRDNIEISVINVKSLNYPSAA